MDFVPYVPGTPLTPAAPLDVAVAPGETLREALEELHMSQLELAGRIGVSAKHVNQIIQGLVPISADVAQRLESATGITARFWARLESDYQTAKAKDARSDSLAAAVEWVKDVPVKALVKAGVLPGGKFTPKERVDQTLRFFGIASVDALDAVVPSAAFRKSAAHKQDQFATAAWLRLGEVAAREVDIPDYSAQTLRSSLPAIRALTELEPRTALPRLVEIAHDAGVAVVFIPEVEGARAYGATFWVSARRPVVLLSARGGTLDKFWETLFHELGHVLLHDKKSVFIEDDDDQTIAAVEEEATEFSRTLLMPDVTAEGLAALHTEAQVSAFAENLGIASGIVVAELQRQGLWGFEQGKRLRRTLGPADLDTTARPSVRLTRPSRLQWKEL